MPHSWLGRLLLIGGLVLLLIGIASLVVIVVGRLHG